MKDYNFFSDYVFVKSTFNVKKMIVPFVFVVVFGIIGGAYYFMSNMESDLQTEYDLKQRIIDSDEYKKVLEDVLILREEVANLRLVDEEVYLFELLMRYSYPVTDDLVSTILLITPRNVAFESYTITETFIEIIAITTDYSYVAEMESNLRNLNVFNKIFVANISNESEDEYRFSILISLGGMMYE